MISSAISCATVLVERCKLFVNKYSISSNNWQLSELCRQDDTLASFEAIFTVFWRKSSSILDAPMKPLQQLFAKKKYLQSLSLMLTLAIIVTSAIAFPANATGIYQIPKIVPGASPWVIDQSEVLSRINESTISSNLEKLAKQTGNEVRIVTIRRLDYGETPESFTKGLFKKWFPTSEAQANQTLLVIDTLSSGTAMETGDKAKSLLTDDIAASVVNETILAPLKQDEKYNQAFLDASTRLIAVLSGEPDPGPPQIVSNVSTERTFKTAAETDTNNATIWVVGFLIAATIIPMATYYLYVK